MKNTSGIISAIFICVGVGAITAGLFFHVDFLTFVGASMTLGTIAKEVMPVPPPHK